MINESLLTVRPTQVISQCYAQKPQFQMNKKLLIMEKHLPIFVWLSVLLSIHFRLDRNCFTLRLLFIVLFSGICDLINLAIYRKDTVIIYLIFTIYRTRKNIVLILDFIIQWWETIFHEYPVSVFKYNFQQSSGASDWKQFQCLFIPT